MNRLDSLLQHFGDLDDDGQRAHVEVIRRERGIRKRHTKAKTKTPVQKTIDLFKKLNPEERAAFLAGLR